MQHDVIGDRTGGLHKVNGRGGVSVRSREDGLVMVMVVAVVCVCGTGHNIGADAGASAIAIIVPRAILSIENASARIIHELAVIVSA